MLLGIMSDTHDDMEQIKKAVGFFNSKKAGMVLHAGDLVSPFTFEALDLLEAGFAGVFGNNDGDKLLLNEKSGGRLFNQPHIVELDGKRLVVVHEPKVVEELAASGKFDAVIYGHLHRKEIRKSGNGTLILSPGKVARLHKGESTVALLDTGTMEAGIFKL